MRIHIVTETESQRWVLRPLAEALAAAIPGASVSTKVDPAADVNFFVNYALLRPVPTITAALFTHREEGGLGKLFDDIARRVDWCFAMCARTAVLLPRGKTTILPLFPDRQFYKAPRLVLGVVGREYKSGRKRLHLVADLETIKGVKVVVSGGALSWEEMPSFYDSIDYLVVISDNEGGPIPVLEAIARGKPIIAPNVGFCWGYPVLRYSTKEDLLRLIQRLVLPRPSEGWKESARIIQEALNRLGECHDRR